MTNAEDAAIGFLVFLGVFFVGAVALDRVWWPLVFLAAVAAGFGTFIMVVKR